MAGSGNQTADPMVVEVWADVVCPWCRLGKAYLDRAISEFEHADAVMVRYRSYELDPHAPAVRPGALIEHLAEKLGRSPEQVDELHAAIVERGAAVDVNFNFDVARPGNTFDAHRLLHMAAEQGRQEVLANALFDAYFTNGEAIGDPESLARIAAAAGFDEAEVRHVLQSTAYTDAVRADEAQARQFQITGVPFFVFDRRVAAGGAQPPEVLLSGLRQAWMSREA